MKNIDAGAEAAYDMPINNKKPSMTRPLIGITMDRHEGGGYSPRPWCALRMDYASIVVACGGLPFYIPYEEAHISDYMARVDGIIIPGGDWDVDPALYGDTTRHSSLQLNSKRTEFDIAMCHACLDSNTPLLAICAGEQALNVALGGSLWQHIPDAIPEALAHHDETRARAMLAHPVTLTAGTLLGDICGSVTHIEVNSHHHQAVNRLGRGVVVSAVAPDGVIEAIEVPSQRFCLGVEWHPELDSSVYDRRIVTAFIAACRG